MSEQIDAIISQLMMEFPDRIEQTKKKPAMLGWWVGMIMKKSGGQANPREAIELVKKRLGISSDLPMILVDEIEPRPPG